MLARKRIKGKFVSEPLTLDMIFDRVFTIPFCGCWIWMGSDNGKDGDRAHGKIRYKGRSDYVHRAAWELFNGKKVPAGLVIDHLCRVRLCCNPDHLEAVTHVENTIRGDSPIRPRCERVEEPPMSRQEIEEAFTL